MSEIKKKIDQHIVQIIVWPLVVGILFLTTSPKKSLFVSFVFFVIVWWWLSIVISVIRQKTSKATTHKITYKNGYYRLSSQVMALCLVILLGLSTLHQLGFMDIVWTLLFGWLCMFYIRRRMIEQ